MLPSNMLLLNLVLPIDVTFSTPTPDFNNRWQTALDLHQMVSPWDEYRKRRNLVWFAFLGYVPTVFGVGVLSIRLFSTFTPAFVFAVAWMAFLVVAGNLVTRFSCP